MERRERYRWTTRAEDSTYEKQVGEMLKDHVGKAQAIKAREIARRLGLEGRYADRPVRDAIRNLRRNGWLILSGVGKRKGYFLAASPAEWAAYGKPMRGRALDLLKTVAEMERTAGRLFGVPEELRPVVQEVLGL